MNFLFITDKGDVLLSSCGQDYAVRIWCISLTFEEDHDNSQETSVNELPLSENIKMKGKILNFQTKGKCEYLLGLRCFCFFSFFF